MNENANEKDAETTAREIGQWLTSDAHLGVAQEGRTIGRIGAWEHRATGKVEHVAELLSQDPIALVQAHRINGKAYKWLKRASTRQARKVIDEAEHGDTHDPLLHAIETPIGTADRNAYRACANADLAALEQSPDLRSSSAWHSHPNRTRTLWRTQCAPLATPASAQTNAWRRAQARRTAMALARGRTIVIGARGALRFAQRTRGGEKVAQAALALYTTLRARGAPMHVAGAFDLARAAARAHREPACSLANAIRRDCVLAGPAPLRTQCATALVLEIITGACERGTTATGPARRALVRAARATCQTARRKESTHEVGACLRALASDDNAASAGVAASLDRALQRVPGLESHGARIGLARALAIIDTIADHLAGGASGKQA